jgi:hypothetical protein
MEEYRKKLKLYGPTRELTIDDFLILKYVYPEVRRKSIGLNTDEIYEVPDYLRGFNIDEMKYPNRPFNHLDAYRAFLRMNPSISKENPNQKYSIRANSESGWNIQKFIRAWVLNYYTDLYEDIEIIED